MQQCEYGTTCPRYDGLRMVCPRVAEDRVDTCDLRELMPCGHARLYFRWAGGYRDTPIDRWCAKCEEEAESGQDR